jgi:hypothetical protein
MQLCCCMCADEQPRRATARGYKHENVAEAEAVLSANSLWAPLAMPSADWQERLAINISGHLYLSAVQCSNEHSKKRFRCGKLVH